MLYFIIIMCVIMMFLVVLALYRFHTIDKLEKEHKEEVERLKDSILNVQEENGKLRTFKYIVENYVTGQRTASEKVNKIKELLYK